MGGALRWRALAGVAVFSVLMLISIGGAQAQNAFHGIGFVKGCDSPTKVGDPYICSYQILNVVDTAHDTIKITGLTDVVHSAGGDVPSGNILPSLQLVFSGPTVTCTGGSGGDTFPRCEDVTDPD